MPRRSKRLKCHDETSTPTDATSDNLTEPGPSFAAAVPKPKRNVRGRRGALQSLPEMPLDILVEVSI